MWQTQRWTRSCNKATLLIYLVLDTFPCDRLTDRQDTVTKQHCWYNWYRILLHLTDPKIHKILQQKNIVNIHGTRWFCIWQTQRWTGSWNKTTLLIYLVLDSSCEVYLSYECCEDLSYGWDRLAQRASLCRPPVPMISQ